MADDIRSETLAASVCIFGEITFTPADIEQAIDRIHRIGTTASRVLARFVVLENSLDARIMELLVYKAKTFAAVMGD